MDQCSLAWSSPLSSPIHSFAIAGDPGPLLLQAAMAHQVQPSAEEAAKMSKELRQLCLQTLVVLANAVFTNRFGNSNDIKAAQALMSASDLNVTHLFSSLLIFQLNLLPHITHFIKCEAIQPALSLAPSTLNLPGLSSSWRSLPPTHTHSTSSHSLSARQCRTLCWLIHSHCRGHFPVRSPSHQHFLNFDQCTTKKCSAE